MALHRVGARFLTGARTVGDVPPVIGRDVAGVDAGVLCGVDVAQHLLDLRPTFDLEQNLAAGTHERQRLVGLAGRDGAHDVDAREDRSEVIGGPANEGKCAPARKESTTAASIDDLFVRFAAEPDPVLDPLFYPSQFDMGEVMRSVARSARGRRARGEPRRLS